MIILLRSFITLCFVVVLNSVVTAQSWPPSSGGGGGAVSSVSNTDGFLDISPTTGAVVGGLHVEPGTQCSSVFGTSFAFISTAFGPPTGMTFDGLNIGVCSDIYASQMHASVYQALQTTITPSEYMWVDYTNNPGNGIGAGTGVLNGITCEILQISTNTFGGTTACTLGMDRNGTLTTQSGAVFGPGTVKTFPVKN